MKLSTRGRYAVRVMMDIAENNGEEDIEWVKLKDISERQEISRDYIVQLTTALRNAGLLISKGGNKGGYTLAKPVESISVLDILIASIGPISILECVSDPKRCGRNADCRSHRLWKAVNQKLDDMLASVTLEDLVFNEPDFGELFDVDVVYCND